VSLRPVLLLLFLLLIPGTFAWYDNGWLYRKNITFNSSQINGTHSDFPVLVNLASDSDLSARAQSSGNDILFTASDGATKLAHEIEKYNGTTGQLIAWVRVPTFSNTSNTIFLYYGNSSVGDQSNKTGVWDSNYLAVYHMSQAPPNIVLDSTGRRNLTQLSTNQSAGQIGGALFLNGTASRLNTTVYTVNLSNFTIEAWVQNNNTGSYWGDTSGRPSGGTGWEAIVDIDNNGTPFRDFSVDGETADVGSLVVDDGSSYPATHDKVSGQMSGKAWTHVAVRYSNGTNGPLRGFVNGTMTANTPVENWTTTNARIVVGAYATAGTTFTDYWYGSIDEVRISSTNRSNAWIQTEYNNQRSGTTFTSVGTQENLPGGSCTYPGSGNWLVQCSDSCILTSNVNLGNNNVTFNGSGNVTLKANITGWKKLEVTNGCAFSISNNGGIWT